MTAFDKKVNQIAARHGWNISPVSGWYIPAYSIVPMDRKERDQITAAPAFSAAVVAPVQGCFCCLPKGSDSSLNGILLQW